MAARKQAPVAPADDSPRHALSTAFLAMLPMFVAYELGVRALGGTRRSAAEVLLGLGLTPFGAWSEGIRWGLLAAFAVVAL